MVTLEIVKEYLAPLLTIALFICGVVVWRLQLVAKRRFEVAEQALAAFYRASDGLSALRSPMVWAGEQQSIEVPDGLEKDREHQLRMYGAYAARDKAAALAFADLRTAQILAEIHLGRGAAQAMQVLFRGRQEVFAAVDTLYGGLPFDTEGLSEDKRKEQDKFLMSSQRVIAQHRRADGTPAEHDEVSQRIDGAKTNLENACRRFLDDPPWLKKVSCLWVNR